MNYFKYVATIFILLLSFSALDQVTYQKLYGDVNSSYNLFTDACTTSDNEIVNVGYWSTDVPPSSVNPFVTKVDANGDVLWSKGFSSPGIGFAQSIAETSDGGYLVAGAIDTVMSGGTYEYDAFILRLDQDGNLLWMKIIGSSADETFKRIYEAPNGDIIAVGLSESTMNSDERAWFVRLTSTGTVINSFIYFVSENSEAHTLLFHPDGGYIIGGVGFNNNEDEAFLFKIADNGTLEWFKSYGTPGDPETIYDMVMLSDTSVVFVGTRGLTDKDIFVGKADRNGDLLWFKNYSGSESDEAYRIIPDMNGGFLLGGSTEGLDGATGHMVIKIDAGGDIEWTNVMGDVFTEGTVGLNQLSNGAIVHSGTLWSDMFSRVGSVFQLNENGEGCNYTTVTLPGITTSIYEDVPTPYASNGPNTTNSFIPTEDDVALLDSTVCSDLSINEQKIEENLKVYPNPVEQGDEVWVSWSKTKYEAQSIEVIDYLGRAVYSGNVTNSLFSISTDDWAKGIYTVIVRSGEYRMIKRVVLN